MKTKTSKSINHKFNCLDEFMLFNEFQGYYYFAPGTMKSFRARVYPTLYCGRFFVDSIKGPFDYSPRSYRIVNMRTNGSTDTLDLKFSSKKSADNFASKYLTFEIAKLLDLSVKYYNTGKFSDLLKRTILNNMDAWTQIKDLELTADFLINRTETLIKD